MKQNRLLIDVLQSLFVQCRFIHKNIFEIEDIGKFIFIESKNNKVIDENFSLILSEEEFDFVADEELNLKFYCFLLGNVLYYSEIGEELVLNRFQYLGKSTMYIETDFPYLGIHTGYEICAAIGMPDQISKKAKFLGYKTIGISQTCTANGVIDFQQICKKNGVNSVLGILIHVETYDIILYAKNEIGWKNILNLQSMFSVFKNESINIETLFKHSNGLVCVLANKYDFSNLKKYIKTFGDDLYFKIDTVEWKSNERDKNHLLNIKKYFNEYQEIIKPCIICETFYLEQQQSSINKFLNSVIKLNQPDSDNQYLKSIDIIQSEIIKLFSDAEVGKLFFDYAFECTIQIANKCKFQIETGQKYLPKYEMNDDEKEKFKDNDELFWHLIEKGVENKLSNVDNIDEYIERIQKEYDVLTRGGVVDYFLILHDVCRWMNSQGIEYGIGRGSAAGALTTYLLNITKILDPIKFKLLFERFLNESRLISALPDIDTDIQGDHRERVKQYLRDKYGNDRVAEVGTYQNFKLKSSLTDILKYFGVEHGPLKFMTSLITKEFEDGNITELFKVAIKEKIILSTLQKHPDVVEFFECIVFQPRSRGVHASATIIVPKTEEKKNFFDWAPTEVLDENNHLVTQWDGVRMEEIGYLKEDLLGLAQLDKFADMKKLIKKNHDVDIVIENIPLDDKTVFEFFHEGLNEDVFQFTSESQKQYTQYLKPDNIEELIAANALYRPGPMDTGAHIKFVKMKYGEEQPDFLPNLEEIVGYTGYLFIYQEQSMLTYQKMTNCSLREADDFRKFLTKLKGDNQSDDKYKKHEAIFIQGYEKNFGVKKEVAQEVWDKLVGFASYGFNRSHAAAYAITGYIAQWFKVYYPLEFWVTALNRVSNSEDIPRRINEINKLQIVKVLSPDVNYSSTGFTYDNNNNIFWSISSIKQAGEKSVEKFLNERDINGKFYSFEEFYTRCGAKKLVNKAVIENLILCGCFDLLEKVEQPKDRLKIIKQFEKLSKNDLSKYNDEKYQKNYVWQQLTKQLCEYDDIQYQKFISDTIFKISAISFFDYERIINYSASNKNNHVLTAGIISEIIVRTTKTNKKIIVLKIDQNNNFFHVVLWDDCYRQYKELFDSEDCTGKIIFVSGRCAEDTHRKTNSIYSTEKTKLQLL